MGEVAGEGEGEVVGAGVGVVVGGDVVVVADVGGVDDVVGVKKTNGSKTRSRKMAKNSKKVRNVMIQTATLQIGYRGMLELARRSGQIKSVSARVVRRDDIFSYQYGANGELTHIPKSAPDAEITHVYAVARFKDGGFAIEVLSKMDVEAIRNSAKAGQCGPWVSHWSGMAQKTAIKQLFKHLPTSTQIARAVQVDELGEQGINLRGAEIITEDGEVISDPVQSGTVDVAAIAEVFGAEQ